MCASTSNRSSLTLDNDQKRLEFISGLFLLLLPLFSLSVCAAERTSVSLDALYWKATENNLGYAIDHGSIQNPRFDWDPGFRLGLAHTFPHDNWSLALGLTYFRAHSTTHGSSPSLIPTWASTDASGTVDAATARFRLHFALLDLTLARTFQTSCLHLIPRIGIQYSVIRQKYYLNYAGGTLFPGGFDIIHMKNKFWGIGPLFGLNTRWILSSYWHLFLNSSLSLPLGQVYVHQSEKASTGVQKRLQVFNIFNSIHAIATLSAGLGWHYRHLALQLAWDELFCPGQNQLSTYFIPISPKSIQNNADLSINGLSLSATYQF